MDDGGGTIGGHLPLQLASTNANNGGWGFDQGMTPRIQMSQLPAGETEHALDNGGLKTSFGLCRIVDIIIENDSGIFTQLKFGFIFKHHLSQSTLVGLDDVPFVNDITFFDLSGLTIGAFGRDFTQQLGHFSDFFRLWQKGWAGDQDNLGRWSRQKRFHNVRRQ